MGSCCKGKMEELNSFIKSNLDPRELRRGLAVSMAVRGHKHREIIKILQVSSGFISKWKIECIRNGIEGLKLKHLRFKRVSES